MNNNKNSIIGWDPIDAHADAYPYRPDIQESIRREEDAGGIAAIAVSASVEVAA